VTTSQEATPVAKVYCGVDWAESHHDLALVDEHGGLVAKRRITESVEGFEAMLELLAPECRFFQTVGPVVAMSAVGLS
jgi:Transposase